MNRNYPKLKVDLRKLMQNTLLMKELCDKNGISIAGVVKGCNAISGCCQVFDEAGLAFIASSRVEQIKEVCSQGITTPKMLLRIPMMSELDQVVQYCQISLQSDIEVLGALNIEARKRNKIHKVILMVDLGDLREGFWTDEELLEAAKFTENLSNIELAGIGTNLGCYGAIAPTKEKMEELVEKAEKVESLIGRKLEYIGGGATSSLPLLLPHVSEMPERINLLRVGEGIINARDLPIAWNIDMGPMNMDVFTLEAQVIEVRTKASHPVGKIMIDAFCNTPTYIDRGDRKRALLGIGKADYAYLDAIFPRKEGVEIIGASSDHTIIDIEEADDIKVGDILTFDICYASMLFLTNSPNLNIEYIEN